jgi:hypothetical protein
VGGASVCPKAANRKQCAITSGSERSSALAALCVRCVIAGKLELIENVSDSADFSFSGRTAENVISSLYLIGPTVGQYAALLPLVSHCTADLREPTEASICALLRVAGMGACVRESLSVHCALHC